MSNMRAWGQWSGCVDQCSICDKQLFAGSEDALGLINAVAKLLTTLSDGTSSDTGAEEQPFGKVGVRAYTESSIHVSSYLCAEGPHDARRQRGARR